MKLPGSMSDDDDRALVDPEEGARKLSDEIEQLRGLLGGLNALSNVPELVRIQGLRMESLLAWRDATMKGNSKLEVTLEKLDTRLDEVERAFIKIEAQISTLSNRIGEVFSTLTERINHAQAEIDRVSKEARASIAAMELRIAESDRARADADRARDLRIASLESDRARAKWSAGILVLLAGLFAWFASSRFWPGK